MRPVLTLATTIALALLLTGYVVVDHLLQQVRWQRYDLRSLRGQVQNHNDALAAILEPAHEGTDQGHQQVTAIHGGRVPATASL